MKAAEKKQAKAKLDAKNSDEATVEDVVVQAVED